MKRFCLLSVAASMLVISTCNDREDYFTSNFKNVTVVLESPLTACTSTYPGFINHDYVFNFTLTPEYSKADPFPLVAQFKCENAGSFELSLGNKKYSPSDTIIFKSLSKKMKMNVIKAGTYRFFIQFFKEDKREKILGEYEFTFVIGMPDLNMYIVRNGIKVENLEETENFLESVGSFIVRVNSEKEDLNKGRVTLTAKITGSSVQVLNWKDNEAKISQSDDLPQSVDFLVQYKNIQLGKTKFVFLAKSQNSNAVLRDSMDIQEPRPGSLSLTTTYNEEKKYYSREQLWVGQTDSVEYRIHPDQKAVSEIFRMKFEMKDPTKLWLFNTGNESKQNASTMYDVNVWHNFSDQLNGKLYYVFPSPTSYSDTVFISLQNGEMGPITRYKLFVSCKQSDDFDFNVAFKKTLVDGYDEIKLSELTDGIIDLVTLNANDENPHSKFDYYFSFQNNNELQRNLIYRAKRTEYENMSDVPFGSWLASNYGYLIDSKSFNIICRNSPTDETAGGYIGTFNWVYEIKRISDDKRKTVTRQIRIIDDRLNFLIELAPGNSRETTYQNEILTTYQLKYLSPSVFADDYILIVTSSNENAADVYLMNKDLTFKKNSFGAIEAPPASHNTNGSILAPSEIGKIQIKGKQQGTAILTFTLEHKASGSTKSASKTVTTIADPVQYIIESAPTLDAVSKERAIIPFGGQFHTYQNPRFKIRMKKSSLYSDNTTGTAKVVFSTIPSLTNVAKLTIRGGTSGNPGYHWNTNVNIGTVIELAYDADYFVTTSSSLPWAVPIGSEQFVNIRMIKATNPEQTPIEAEFNNVVKYTLRAYRKAQYQVTGEPYNESWCDNENTETSNYPVYVYQANVIISPDYYSTVTRTTCNGTFYVKDPVLKIESLNDVYEFQGQPYFTTSTMGYYNKEQVAGWQIAAINPSQPPSDPDWQSKGAGVRVTSYGGSIKATVRDNWGYNEDVYVTIPSKIVYGRW